VLSLLPESKGPGARLKSHADLDVCAYHGQHRIIVPLANALKRTILEKLKRSVTFAMNKFTHGLCLLFLATQCITLSVAQAAHSGNATQNAIPDFIQKVMDERIHWDRGFDQPPGSHLRFVKKSETKRSSQHVNVYRVFVDGGTEDTEYSISIWPATEQHETPMKSPSPFYVNRKGLLMNRKPTKDEEDSESLAEGELDLAFAQAGPGEPLRAMLRSNDGKQVITGTQIDAPVVSTNGPCHAALQREMSEGMIMLFYLDGFPPDTPITINSNSAGEERIFPEKTDSKGHVAFIERPRVLKVTSGTVTETVKTDLCTISISMRWGKKSDNP